MMNPLYLMQQVQNLQQQFAGMDPQQIIQGMVQRGQFPQDLYNTIASGMQQGGDPMQVYSQALQNYQMQQGGMR